MHCQYLTGYPSIPVIDGLKVEWLKSKKCHSWNLRNVIAESLLNHGLKVTEVEGGWSSPVRRNDEIISQIKVYSLGDLLPF